MLDRSMNFFIDPIFKHSEIVKKEYTGFTLFKNTIAFGPNTNISTPPLFLADMNIHRTISINDLLSY